MTNRFEKGKIYLVKSRCDRVYFEVTARTAKTATFKLIGKQENVSRFDPYKIEVAGNGETQKSAIRVEDNVEYGSVKVEVKTWNVDSEERVCIEAKDEVKIRVEAPEAEAAMTPEQAVAAKIVETLGNAELEFNFAEEKNNRTVKHFTCKANPAVSIVEVCFDDGAVDYIDINNGEKSLRYDFETDPFKKEIEINPEEYAISPEALDAAVEAETELASVETVIEKYLKARDEVSFKYGKVGQILWYHAKAVLGTGAIDAGKFAFWSADHSIKISKNEAGLYLEKYGLTVDEFVAAEKEFYAIRYPKTAEVNPEALDAAVEAETESANAAVETAITISVPASKCDDLGEEALEEIKNELDEITEGKNFCCDVEQGICATVKTSSLQVESIEKLFDSYGLSYQRYVFTANKTEAETKLASVATTEVTEVDDDNVFDLLPTLDELNDVEEDPRFIIMDDAEYTERNARFNHGERHAANLQKELRKIDPTVEVTYDIDDEDDRNFFRMRFDGFFGGRFWTIAAVEERFHELKADIAGKIECQLQGGGRTLQLDRRKISVTFEDARFKFIGRNIVLAKYDTAEEVDQVIDLFKAAIARGDKSFKFPTFTVDNKLTESELAEIQQSIFEPATTDKAEPTAAAITLKYKPHAACCAKWEAEEKLSAEHTNFTFNAGRFGQDSYTAENKAVKIGEDTIEYDTNGKIEWVVSDKYGALLQFLPSGEIAYFTKPLKDDGKSFYNELDRWCADDFFLNLAERGACIIGDPKPTDDFASKLAELESKEAEARAAVEKAKVALLATQNVRDEAEAEYHKARKEISRLLNTTASKLTEKIWELPLNAITLKNQDGKSFKAQHGGTVTPHIEHTFKISNGWKVCGYYDTPAQVTCVIEMLTAALKAGKTEFTFPTIDELNQANFTADSLKEVTV